MELDTLLHDSFNALTISESRSEQMLNAIDRELTTAEPKIPEIMTVEEVAEYLRVTPSVILDLMGDIPCFEIGGRVLFRKEAITDWILKKERDFNRQLDHFGPDSGLQLCL